MDGEDQSLLEKLDSLAPESMKSFDAFPKLPATYKSRSESRGFLTVFVAFLAFLLVLNDIGDFIWGWPDHEFQVDKDDSSFMNVNVDVVVNMPCRCEYQSVLSSSLYCPRSDILYSCSISHWCKRGLICTQIASEAGV